MVENNLRVAMLIQAYLPHIGGAERQLDALLPLLKQRGVDAFVLTRRFSGLSSFEMINNTPVYRLPIPGPKPLAAMSFTVATQMKIAHLHPDVIHAHELLSPATAAILAKKIFGRPVVAKVLRGGDLGDLAKLKNRRLGEKRIASLKKGIDSFIVISQEIDKELTEVGILPEKKVFIPNGVDLNRFSLSTSAQKKILRKSLGLPLDGLIVIFSGRLDPEKRVNHLIDIWPSILARHSDASLLILGVGSEAERLRETAGKNIIFKGSVLDTAPYLQSADVFVLPSATEGLSNSLLEALSVGLPCVATAVGGTPDVVIHNENGMLISPDNPDALRISLIDLLSDSSKRERLGKASRELIRSKYSLENTADRLSDLYRQLTKRGKK